MEDDWEEAGPRRAKREPFPIIGWADPRLMAHPDYQPFYYKDIHVESARAPSGPTEGATVVPNPPNIQPVIQSEKHSAYNCSSSFENLAARVSVYLAKDEKKNAEDVLAHCVSTREYQKGSNVANIKAAYKLVSDALTLVTKLPAADAPKKWMRFYEKIDGHTVFTIEDSPEEFRKAVNKSTGGKTRRKNGRKRRSMKRRT